MIQQSLTVSFKVELLQAKHNFLTDDFYLALYTDQATLNSSTTAYTTAGEVVASGYTAGGLLLTNTGLTPTSMGTVAFTSFNTATWNSDGIIAKGGLIYNATAAGKPSVMTIDFGINRASANGVFSVTFPPFNNQYALIRLGSS